MSQTVGLFVSCGLLLAMVVYAFWRLEQQERQDRDDEKRALGKPERK